MKSRTILILSLAVVLVVAFAACQRNVGSSAATTRTTTAATTTAVTTTTQTTTTTTTTTTEDTSTTDETPGTDDTSGTDTTMTGTGTSRGRTAPRSTTGATVMPGVTTRSTTSRATSGIRRAGSVAAMSTDFSEIGALDATRLDWGSGGPKDANGRSQGAISYQGKYGRYDAHFIAPESEKIYLTFDEGYENGQTPSILDTLKKKGVPAVFFVTYDFAKDNPELIQRMIDEGHIIGNHSYKHKYMADIPLDESFEEIKILHEYILENFGYEMNLFRFPSGCFNEQTLALAQQMGYTSVFWSFAYLDYDINNQMGAEKAFAKVSEGAAHPGAIILLHAVSSDNAVILGDVIDKLRADGFVFSAYDVQYQDQ